VPYLLTINMSRFHVQQNAVYSTALFSTYDVSMTYRGRMVAANMPSNHLPDFIDDVVQICPTPYS